MRVLMFGWEFPPYISGGLGTACYGMTKGLAANGVEVLFVMPSASGDEDQSAVSIINASDVPVDTVSTSVEDFLDKVRFVHIHSNMMPYVDPQEFSDMLEEERRRQVKSFSVSYGQKYKFSGKYGSNLMEEVARYAMVGATIALQHKDEFDVIHAHDWLTYLAGAAAKELTGKPLVVHVHATSFDRSSDDKIDTRVYDIERKGMEAADRVIAVSELTRNIVINRYGISPDKVVAVHNAVDFSGRESNVRFVMAGSGDMLNRCIRHVARLGISDRFHFTGFLRGTEVQRMFELSDVYIMPSVSEPFGISPLEAMQTNVPTIISKQSGVAEVLKYAIKVDFWDIDAMADAIYGLLNYSAMADMAARCGHDEVNALKWNNAAYKIKKVYESVIK